MPSQGPSLKDLYEKVDDKLDKVTDRLSRMEKGLIVLTVLVVAPKIGAPSASELVGAVLHGLL